MKRCKECATDERPIHCRSMCRRCYNRLHRATCRDQRHDYYMRNRVRIIAEARARYRANREAILAQQKDYRVRKRAKKNRIVPVKVSGWGFRLAGA
jgi:tRNA G26 N,N-dimethylase Trm1